MQGGAAKALLHFETALRLKPGYADAHYNLGVAYANKGPILEAIAQLEAAQRLKPDPRLQQTIDRLRAGKQ